MNDREVSFRVACVSTGSPLAMRPDGATWLLRLEVPDADESMAREMLAALQANPGAACVRLVAMREPVRGAEADE